MKKADNKAGSVTTRFQELIPGLTRSLAQCPGVVAVILFGSAAGKRMTPLSDLDICVVTRPDLSHDEWETIMSYSGPDVDLAVFRDLPPVLRYRVIRDGIVLWAYDRKSLHRVRADALRSYLDLKPFIGRNARRILEITAAKP